MAPADRAADDPSADGPAAPRSGPEDSAVHPRGATVAYTDGACRGNPGPGGWAWAVPGGRWESGADPDTTNQRMEILAAWRAVQATSGPLHVVSDSTYVVNCFRDEWWRGWLKRGWKNSKKEPVANRDLWEPFIEAVRDRADGPAAVSFDWVKGHGGDPMNDLVDRLAVAAALRGTGASGDGPPSEDDLAEPDRAAPASVMQNPRLAATPASQDPLAGGGAARGDSRVPPGTPWVVVGLRTEALVASAAGSALRRRLAAVLGAQQTLHDDLVVLTGLRAGTEDLAALAARRRRCRLCRGAALPRSGRRLARGRTGALRGVVRRGVAGGGPRAHTARPTGRAGARPRSAGRLAALGERPARWSSPTDVTPRPSSLLRRFTESLGDEVWTIELDEL